MTLIRPENKNSDKNSYEILKNQNLIINHIAYLLNQIYFKNIEKIVREDENYSESFDYQKNITQKYIHVMRSSRYEFDFYTEYYHQVKHTRCLGIKDFRNYLRFQLGKLPVFLSKISTIKISLTENIIRTWLEDSAALILNIESEDINKDMSLNLRFDNEIKLLKHKIDHSIKKFIKFKSDLNQQLRNSSNQGHFV